MRCPIFCSNCFLKKFPRACRRRRLRTCSGSSPMRSIVATFGPETEEPEIVPFGVDGIAAGNTTFGHRFLAPAPIRVRRFDDYVPALDAARVVLDPARRRDIILHDARNLALAHG